MSNEAKECLRIIEQTQEQFHALMKPKRQLTKEQFHIACDLLCVVAVAGRGLIVNAREIPQMPEMVRKMISNMTRDLERYR